MSPATTLYRGHEGMWMWVVHRTTGVAIFFFLLVHVLDTALVRVSPEAYNEVIGSYKTPLYAIVEAGLVAAIALHALNGLRVIAVDRSTWALRHQKMLVWWVWIGFAVIMLGFLPRHLMHAFGGA
ncbi:succinate dehydrogenase, cytochrome b556 subunit [Demequina litorisediminis]|uniref:Succinate dehydrogenase, cytochrome b556 subunit n=2 Tax=Demequinaceae TaxID=1042322 RepID=A0ABQ6IAH9_9MICO|nr:succinate dehydrogenase, cytochrome b556 subunit [Demequina litorisediminis]GMA34857.1 succinate dehydrogenase, cytochrome b556 subunit [Demequina litorisediminis]